MLLEIIGADGTFDGLNTSFFFYDYDMRGVLVECGFTVYPELVRRNLVDKVDIVLLSHNHTDHAGSLPTLAVYSRMYRKKKLIVGGNEDEIKKLFDTCGVRPNEDYEFLPANDPLNLRIKRVAHIPGEGPSNAIYIHPQLFYSGDTSESLLDTEYAKEAQVIIHDCWLKGAAHVNFDVLAAAPLEIRKKTYLAHIPSEERAEITRLAAENGFAGVLESGGRQRIRILDGGAFDILTEDGRTTGQTANLSEVIAKKHPIATAAVWIMNSKGQVLLQKNGIKEHPGYGMWRQSATAKMMSGEAPEICAVRMLSDELGLSIKREQLIKLGIAPYKFRGAGPAFCHVFLVENIDVEIGDLNLYEPDIIEEKWFDLEYVKNWEQNGLEINPADFVPRLNLLLDYKGD